MNLRNYLILFIIAFSLLHFSPQIVNATTNEESEQVTINEDEADTDETEKTEGNELTTEEEVTTDQKKTDTTDQEETDTSTVSEEGSTDSQSPIESDSNKGEIDEKPTVETDTAETEEGQVTEEPEKSSKTDNVEERTEESPNESADDETRQTTTFSSQSTPPFEKGDKHEDILLLKEKLNAIGFDGILETENFGGWTETRFRQFQDYYGLTVSGKASEETVDKLDKVYDSPFQEGGNDEAIIPLKEKLNRMGFDNIAVTDYYGGWTETRVEQFQRFSNLVVNGIADSVTRAKLNELVENGFQQGDSHDALINLKEKLNAVGFDGILETDYFGDWTETRVEQFQDYYALPVTGTANAATLNKLDEVYYSPFQEGESDEAIISLKEKLNRMGFDNIAVTDYFGGWTETRLKQFQSFSGLVVNGIADSVTRAKLNELVENGFQQGDSHDALINLKEKLNAVGFDGILETDYFGGWTETRVEQFQDYYGLPVTGRANAATLNKLDKVYYSPYQEGKSHEDIEPLKEKLNRMGFDNILVSPNFGGWTETRVKHFQEFSGLIVNGIADSVTRAKLDELMENGYQQGDEHESLTVVKEKLNAIGFDRISETDYFGNWTETRVDQFQDYYDLPVTGRVNAATLNKLDKVYYNPFQQGKSHEGIVEIKRDLNKLGFNGIRDTDYFGNWTETRVGQFQEYYGLIVNGIVDDPTLEKIGKVLASPFQQGKRHEDTVQLKRNLNKLGFGDIKVTTLYGNFTESQVREFQDHFGLIENGIADEPTFEKIEEIINSPFQLGNEHEGISDLKKNLTTLGYHGITISDKFGNWTEKRLKEFQEDYGLPVSGIADNVTRSVLKEAAESREVYNYTQYDLSLNEALDIQMGIKNPPPQTDLYRNDPAYIHGDYVEITTSAVINGSEVNIRTAPKFGDTDAYTVDKGTSITIKKEVKGDAWEGSTAWYKIGYKGQTLYVHTSLVNPSVEVAKTTVNLNVRAQPKEGVHIYGVLSKGSEVTIIGKEEGWYEVSYKAWRNAKSSDTKSYLNPTNYDVMQHLDLSSTTKASVSELNQFLNGEGVLERKGQAFIDGGEKYAVNELYLISHAIHETNHGKSPLATGNDVGLNKDGKPVMVNEKNEDKLTNIKTVYNMFGIGANDGVALKNGSIRAYEEEWFTVDAAIEGGAKFIGEDYIHSGYNQNTLYKMRWNPKAMENGGFAHQYATDIGWAMKQVSNLKAMYNLLEKPFYQFDIVQYN